MHKHKRGFGFLVGFLASLCSGSSAFAGENYQLGVSASSVASYWEIGPQLTYRTAPYEEVGGSRLNIFLKGGALLGGGKDGDEIKRHELSLLLGLEDKDGFLCRWGLGYSWAAKNEEQGFHYFTTGTFMKRGSHTFGIDLRFAGNKKGSPDLPRVMVMPLIAWDLP
jgi:hypothetical protein